jgi:serine/threonine protein kinase
VPENPIIINLTMKLSDPAGLPPGTILLNGKYRLERLLGQGAFGEVYLASHQVLGVQRAIKLLQRRIRETIC